MQGWDFTSPGWYFITICTKNMKPAFGTVVNGRMVLNAAGKVAEQCWREIPAHFPRAVVDEYVVMPNHVHGLLHLLDSNTACYGVGGVWKTGGRIRPDHHPVIQGRCDEGAGRKSLAGEVLRGAGAR
jgi:REP element-mobilizing transposase RayT